MSKLDRNFRAALSFALVLIISSISALSSVAASNASRAATREDSDNGPGIGVLNAPVGSVTGTGHFTIDGDEAQPGATVLSGSSVATGWNGDVTIHLGPLGRIVLRPETTIRVTLSKNEVKVSLDRAGSVSQSVPSGVVGRLKVRGGNAHLGVSSGEAEIKLTGSARTLRAGEATPLDHMSEVITKGETLLTIEGGDKSASNEAVANGTEAASGKAPAPVPAQESIIWAGPRGVIALVGAATGVTLGVMAGRNHSSNQISPRPSGVIP
jgi:hypothetical protein